MNVKVHNGHISVEIITKIFFQPYSVGDFACNTCYRMSTSRNLFPTQPLIILNGPLINRKVPKALDLVVYVDYGNC